LQGRTTVALLDRLAFDRAADCGSSAIWSTAACVARSGCFVMAPASSPASAIMTLLCWSSLVKKPHATDTFHDILASPDRDELLHWLRQQKMIHVEGSHVMVHAGLLPQWSVRRAADLGREVEDALRGDSHREFLNHLYGDEPARWHDGLAGIDRLRIITNAMTRMRLTRVDGTMEFRHKAGLECLPHGYMPWYEVPGRASASATVVFGHWASLGLLVRPNLVALDTGCVWGRALSALRLEDNQIVQCDCPEMAGSGGEQ
jgi:bis(5'-nucleosyl)-tetraphosphatase (symmetrical)